MAILEAWHAFMTPFASIRVDDGMLAASGMPGPRMMDRVVSCGSALAKT